MAGHYVIAPAFKGCLRSRLGQHRIDLRKELAFGDVVAALHLERLKLARRLSAKIDVKDRLQDARGHDGTFHIPAANSRRRVLNRGLTEDPVITVSAAPTALGEAPPFQGDRGISIYRFRVCQHLMGDLVGVLGK